jgi:hypothetical protein
MGESTGTGMPVFLQVKTAVPLPAAFHKLLNGNSELTSKDYSTSGTKTKESGMKNENLARKSGKWNVFSKCCLKKLKSGSKTKIGA